jgi:hypothetical protein
MLSGSIGSLKVYVIVSPCSTRPTVAAPLLAWMSDPAGAVLSTVTVKPVWSRLLPALSVDVRLYVLTPAASGLSATNEADR